MATFGDIEYLEVFTSNAQDWADYFDSVSTQYSDRDLYAVALSRTIDEIMQVLMQSLEEAIASSGIEDNEFARPLLRDKLFQVFNNYDIIQIAGGRVYLNAEDVAGDWNDFWDGIERARSMLPGGGAKSQAQKAAFWRNIVYPSYDENSGIDTGIQDFEEDEKDFWSQTIAFRQQGWQGKAPYWLILEYGNAENPLAYPHNEPTRFKYKAELRAQAIFNSAVTEVDTQATNLIEEAADKFIENPELYAEYTILDEFFAEGKLYYVYVTSTRKVGVALEETYESLRRAYGAY